MTQKREVNQEFRLSAMLRRPFSASSHDTTGETDGWRTFLTGSDMESRGLTWEIGMPSHRPFLSNSNSLGFQGSDLQLSKLLTC